MFGVINEDTRRGWQIIADMLSRQHPCPGRTAIVVRGRKMRGARVEILRHQIDRYENVFRYGNEAAHHMRAMSGRSGYVCLVRILESAEQAWIKAKYLACDYAYTHWAVALGDAVQIGARL